VETIALQRDLRFLTIGKLWLVVASCGQKMWRKVCVEATRDSPARGALPEVLVCFVWGPRSPVFAAGEANGSAFAGEALSPARIHRRTAGASATGTADRKTWPPMPKGGRVIPPT